MSIPVLLGILGVVLVAASVIGMTVAVWQRRPEHWQLLLVICAAYLVQYLIAPPEVYTAYTTASLYSVKAGLLAFTTGLFTATITRIYVRSCK